MKKHQLILITWLALLIGSLRPAAAQEVAHVNIGAMIVCELASSTNIPPSFSGDGCTTMNGRLVSPHKRAIWLRMTVDIPETMAHSPRPLGLFISAKAASRAWVNGQLIGNNGEPAHNAEAEVPGRMDAVFPVPHGLLHAGENTVIIQMSGHHGYIGLVSPIHFIAIAAYAAPSDTILREYMPSLLPLGVLVLGALYFGVLAIRRRDYGPRLLIPLTALFSAAQLLAEVSRGFTPYLYPFHDIRLVLILAFAVATGVSLFLHVLTRFLGKHRWLIAGISLVIYAALLLFADGFDRKSSLALLLPSLYAMMIAVYASARGAKLAGGYAAALFLFSGLIFFTPTQFLDTYFYYCVAGLLLFLFIGEIRDHQRERRLREREKARADKLQVILDESRERESPTNIKITSAGKVEFIPTSDIAFCKGAGDYVELGVKGRAPVLHSQSLNDMEAELPGTFLRVHRSYLVNTAFIRALEREASGAQLILTTGETVPVSRRILPSVRKALA
ncbi:LytTR family transcriptional regulator DNA-binding domain-containing protein [Kordiimonas sp.]|uniref:LytTR family transcriptional regulator DNA-binding domain-containing protein n=1 Tax=Kordiimonas sp. TaxID=1970157 RepID=UPI003A907F99